MWLEITTSLPCTNNCSYCPQNKLRQAYKGQKRLEMAEFKKYLSNVEKDTEIHFSGFSEPFLNQECIEMIKHADKEGYTIRLYSTLVGLTDEQAMELENIPFRFVRIHDIGQQKRNYKWIENFSKVTHVVPRAGNLKETNSREVVSCGRCPKYDCNVMLPNGDVVLCCQDYSLSVKLGNLGDTRLKDMKREGPYNLCKHCEYAI